jgi:hypothetical protein
MITNIVYIQKDANLSAKILPQLGFKKKREKNRIHKKRP